MFGYCSLIDSCQQIYCILGDKKWLLEALQAHFPPVPSAVYSLVWTNDLGFKQLYCERYLSVKLKTNLHTELPVKSRGKHYISNKFPTIRYAFLLKLDFVLERLFERLGRFILKLKFQVRKRDRNSSLSTVICCWAWKSRILTPLKPRLPSSTGH